MATPFLTKKYELHQHIFSLIVMAVCRLSLRRVEKFLGMLGYKVPTFSALCKSKKRISPSLFQKALALTTGEDHEIVAIDSIGISRANPSHHYIKRIDRKKPVKSYVRNADAKTTSFRMWMSISDHRRSPHKPHTLVCGTHKDFLMSNSLRCLM